ncbi:sigma-54-dependent transcriptional regulator [Prescottella agglutinans]|uniref:sigma-54-dependent transcriptional regulator n=1 Tax=Prescottella agglutinans TaxID=1644129 RepID=UPI003D986ABD
MGAGNRPASVVQDLCATRDQLRRGPAHCDSDGFGVIVCSRISAEVRRILRRAVHAHHHVIVVRLERADQDPWCVLRDGAVDVMEWRDDPEAVCVKLDRIQEVERLVDSPDVVREIVGRSDALRGALRDLITAAKFGSGAILILGETGTGKELAARVVHSVDNSVGAGQFVVVDCTTIVPGLLGSELFGHERGAFTGAVAARSGACAAADGGTLFLDEVGDLPLDLQPALLRVVQEGAYKRVGGDRWQHSRFRLVCATNRDLADDVRSGRFRRDLFYRVASSTIRLPPIRDRIGDVVDLFGHFYRQATGAAKPVELDRDVESALVGRDYPGNLRDLRQLAHRVASRHVGPGPITPGDLPPADRPGRGPRMDSEPDIGARDGSASASADDLASAVRAALRRGATLRGLRDEISDIAVDVALEASGGNVRAAATALGVTDRALQLRRARARKGSSASHDASAASSDESSS